jgi:hypothetical protein
VQLRFVREPETTPEDLAREIGGTTRPVLPVCPAAALIRTADGWRWMRRAPAAAEPRIAAE